MRFLLHRPGRLIPGRTVRAATWLSTYLSPRLGVSYQPAADPLEYCRRPWPRHRWKSSLHVHGMVEEVKFDFHRWLVEAADHAGDRRARNRLHEIHQRTLQGQLAMAGS